MTNLCELTGCSWAENLQLSWQTAREPIYCSWAYKLQLSGAKISQLTLLLAGTTAAHTNIFWQQELRWQSTSELQLAELTVKLTSWTDPTRKWTSGSWADRLHLSWNITAKLTRCNRTYKSLSSWLYTVELTECSWADKLQMRRKPTAQATCWADMTNLSELTGCSWADNLQLN